MYTIKCSAAGCCISPDGLLGLVCTIIDRQALSSLVVPACSFWPCAAHMQASLRLWGPARVCEPALCSSLSSQV